MPRHFTFAATLALLSLPLAACSAGNVHTNRGFAALSKTHYADAESELKLALQDNPNDPFALLNMGAVLQNTGRGQQAVPYYLRVQAEAKHVYPQRTSGDTSARHSLAEIATQNLTKLAANDSSIRVTAN
ncbi:MAG TPA: hypothetical protein VFF98_04885 [Novosphingobium sp.]|nr:hypothetical protein [Novosphingobium sp.]HZV08356.1 hypothetical protein [Novosphingobium sp.]